VRAGFPGFMSTALQKAFVATADGVSIIESIQEVEVTIASSAASGTATIASVDTANSVVFFGYGIFGGQKHTQAAQVAIDRCVASVDLTNSTTVTAQREVSIAFALTIQLTVVEFTAAAIDSIQAGSITITDPATSNTDTIASVTASRSVVLYNGATGTSTIGSYDRVLTNLSVTNATTITATRDTTTDNCTVNYTVIEFASGITDSVQEFTIAITSDVATTNTATISSVATGNSAIFPGGLRTPDSSFTVDDESTRVDLTNATTVTATRDTASASDTLIAGTVVEFASANIASIQRGTATIGAAETSVDVTVTSVDTSKSLLNSMSCTSDSGSEIDPEEQYYTAEIINATTIRFSRGIATSRLFTTGYELVEFV